VSWTHGGQVPNNDGWSPEISGDGRHVFFTSKASDLTPLGGNGERQVYAVDTQTGSIQCASVSTNGVLGDNQSYNPSASESGRYVTFSSNAQNFGAASLTQVWLRDMASGTTELVSRGHNGQLPNSSSATSFI